MPPRRINDAQTERLLQSLQSLSYRQALARKLAAKEHIQYDSAMRRLQRYITQSGEKRSFARAPVAKRQEVIKSARRLPVPEDYIAPPILHRGPPEQLPLPRVLPPGLQRPKIPPSPLPPVYRKPETREITNYDLRAILAYYDGDLDEAGEALQEFGATARAGDILELASTGVDVLNMRGAGRLADAARDWFDSLRAEDFEDVQDFTDLLMNLPDWKIGLMLEDMAESGSTFAEWLDDWRDNAMDVSYLEGEDGWKLWRALIKQLGHS